MTRNKSAVARATLCGAPLKRAGIVSDQPYWLIFDFHWNGGDSAQVDNCRTSGNEYAYYGLQSKSKNGAEHLLDVVPAYMDLRRHLDLAQ